MEWLALIPIFIVILTYVWMPYRKKRKAQRTLDEDFDRLQKHIDKKVIEFIGEYVIKRPHRTKNEKKAIVTASIEVFEELKEKIRGVVLSNGSEAEIRKNAPAHYQGIKKMSEYTDNILSDLKNDTRKIEQRYEIIHKAKNGEPNNLLTFYRDSSLLSED